MKKSFEEVFIDKTRYGTKIKTDEYCKSGKHIIVDQSQNAIAGFTDLDSGLFTDVPAIIFGDHTRVIKYVDEPFFLGADGTKILRSNICNANYKYLYYALKNARIPNTGYNRHFKWLKEIEIQYPDEKTQNNIASLLDKVLYVINLRKDELQKLDDLIRARFVEMFGDPIENPKNWEITTVGDIVTEVRYGTSKPAVEGGQYPYLRMNNLTADGHLDLRDLKYIDISDEEIEKCVVRTGDVLFNRTNSIDLVGKTAVFDLSEEMVIAGYIIRVRLKKNMLPEVFSEYMNLKALKDILRSMAKGAVNQANINAQELQSIKIYLPDIELQKQFVTIKTQIDKSKATVQKALDETQLLFDSLMQKYFG